MRRPTTTGGGGGIGGGGDVLLPVNVLTLRPLGFTILRMTMPTTPQTTSTRRKEMHLSVSRPREMSRMTCVGPEVFEGLGGFRSGVLVVYR